MSTLQDVEHAIQHMSPTELATFRAWFLQFDAQLWDQQLEDDAASGRLDSLADKALKEFGEGRCTEL